MEANSIIAVVLCALIVWHYARKDYCAGVCWAVFFLVWMPHRVRIETGGVIPELTIHRVILLVLVGVGMSQGKWKGLREKVPLYGLLLAMFLSYAVSMVFAMSPSMAFKRLFAVVFENYLLYITIIVGVKAQQAEKVLKSALLGLLFVALLSPLEYYKGLHVIGKFLPVKLESADSVSTFEDSIHFGFAMAMGLPFAVIFANRAKRFTEFCLYFGGIGMLLAACYFSSSRGALLGAILSVGMLLAMGGRSLRKMSYGMGLIIAIALVARPGVRETIYNQLSSVFVHNGEQEASAEYRKILWKVAWTKVTVSPITFLFGLGGASTMLLDISEFFGAGRGGQLMDQGFSSWDSQWAANLLQYGFSGFLIEVAIWLSVFRTLATTWFGNSDRDKDPLIFGALVGCAVYVWAMMTVAMFSPQLKFLVSAYFGCGILLARRAQEDRELADAGVGSDAGALRPEVSPGNG